MSLVDTHCHLYEPPLADNIAGTLESATGAGVCALVVPGVDKITSEKAIELSKIFKGVVYAAAGLHPHCAGRDVSWLADLAGAPGVVAIGEIGLDAEKGPAIETQAAVFSWQLSVARDIGLPVIVHCRGAFARLYDLLKAAGTGGKGGVLHSYSGSAEMLYQFEKIGFYIGVSGVATRSEASRVHSMLRDAPLGRMVLETDSPYIGTAEHPKGSVTPASVKEVCAALAMLKGETPELVAEVTTENARRVFGV